ncbi:MAG: hypothetical protein O2973_11870 [Gemmatimonadetes bacterium]|nr:hypothetical protein [Gemmatimonadota bacterium]
MNENQYTRVCEACDRVLLSPESTTERIAIPWLHVIREHPVLLKHYVGIASLVKRTERIRERAVRLSRYGVMALRDLQRASRAEARPWFGPGPPPEKVDVLFVSHLLNETGVAQEDDFYFGNIPAQLLKTDRSVLVALINHCGASATSLAGKWHARSVPRLVLSTSLGMKHEIVLFRRMWMESNRLRKVAKLESTSEVSSRVFARAGDEALSSASRTALRISGQIRALVAAHRPEAIVVTHEGHAWERLAFDAARSVNSRIRCVGYQHSALFRLQHAVRRNLLGRYNPDHILTAGAVSKSQLEVAPSLRDTPITVLGSNRSFSSSMSATSDTATVGARAKTCLVVPEGFHSECALLFEFSRRCAEARPDIQFIWRLHPSVTFGELENANKKLANLPNNIERSEAKIQVDLARSGWALYRGTTAVVQAVGAGLRPVYLSVPGELTIDPLHELDAWKLSVTAPAEFLRIIDTAPGMAGEKSRAEEKLAREYCERVFLPFEVDVLTNVLGAPRIT